MDLRKLPKIELHCHLDGSVRIETIIDLVKKEGINCESLDYNFIKEKLVAPDDCHSLDEYLMRFDLPNRVMQNKENLERISYELVEDAMEENIKYLEVRFAPLLHTNEGLEVREIIESVLKGLKRGEEEFGVKTGLILCLLRHMEITSGIEVVEIGKDFLDKGVVALDLAGSEESGFVSRYEDLFKKARDYGFNVTIHAGETGYSINVIEAIKLLKAKRIGHGIAILKDREAYDLVKEMGVVLEMCPTSNVQTKAINSYREHPIDKFLKDDIKSLLCTDNITVSDITLTREYEKTRAIKGLNKEDYKKIYKNGVYGAFCSDAVKEQLLKILNEF